MTPLLNLLNRFENAAGVYERSEKTADRDELHAARRAIMEAFEAAAQPATAWKSRRQKEHDLYYEHVRDNCGGWTEFSKQHTAKSAWEHEVAFYASRLPPPAIMEREAELVKALKPFAKVGRLIDGPFGPALFANDDDAFQSGCAWTEDGERKTLTWGNFRAATAALRSQQNT